MAKFQNAKLSDGSPIRLNVDHVMFAKSDEHETIIVLSNGDEVVLEKINLFSTKYTV